VSVFSGDQKGAGQPLNFSLRRWNPREVRFLGNYSLSGIESGATVEDAVYLNFSSFPASGAVLILVSKQELNKVFPRRRRP